MNVLNVNISETNLGKACQTFDSWIKNREKRYVCVAPVSTIVDCQGDPQYRQIVNGAGMVTPDGMPLVWIGKLRGSKVIQRTYGPDLMLTVCAESQEKGYKHYFFGGAEQTMPLLLKNLKQKFPKLNVAGYFIPPFRKINQIEEQNVIDQINSTNPDILWIGLGSPKQDFWMHNHRSKLNVPIIVGVGAAFDFLAGTKRQAPRWMRRCGLEWLFRLGSEPKRLWKRYIIGNTVFVALILGDWFKHIFRRPQGANVEV